MGKAAALSVIAFVLSHGNSAAAQAAPMVGAELERIVTAVGQVVSPDGDSKETRGSGVIISPDGLVVTCYHVLGRNTRPGAAVEFDPVDGKTLFRLPDPKRALRLVVARTAPEYDLALLRITTFADGRPLAKGGQFQSLPIGKAEELRLLDPVYIIGFPQVGGDTVTVIEGRVAGKDAVNQWLKLDASVSRGYSGGAVVNARGELVGVPAEIRADIENLGGGSAREAAVLYGLLSWVRPVELVARLVASSRDAPLLSSPMLTTGVIRGVVVSTQGAPLSGALVGLLKEGSQTATQENLLTYARTDNRGEFTLRTAPGSYTLRAHCAGYRTASQPVKLLDNLQVRIALTRQPDGATEKPHDK